LPICQITLRAQKPSLIPQNPESIGEHIRKRRLEQSLFQSDVARIIGVEETSIYNWESNRSNPSVKYIPKIIKFLGYIPFGITSASPDEQIKLYRRIRGISQKNLANEIGIDPTTLARMEKNEGESPEGFQNSLRNYFDKLQNQK